MHFSLVAAQFLALSLSHLPQRCFIPTDLQPFIEGMRYSPSGSSNISVNQQQPSGGWFHLGAFAMSAGQNHRVEVYGALEGETVADVPTRIWKRPWSLTGVIRGRSMLCSLPGARWQTKSRNVQAV